MTPDVQPDDPLGKLLFTFNGLSNFWLDWKSVCFSLFQFGLYEFK